MGNFINKLKNYQAIPRELIFDNSLSDRARFIFCYMASKPDDWDFYLDPMAKELGYSVDTIRKYIKELIDSGWLIKGEQERGKGSTFGAVSYTLMAENPTRKKPDTEKTRHGKNTTQIDNISIKKDIYKEIDNINACEDNPVKGKVNKRESKTLFRNSKVYDLVEFSAGGSPDYSKLESKFSGAEFENVDIVYYFHCVADWSDQKDVKRTANGWMATIRNFIRRDMENNKLHKKVNDDFDFEGAMAYLKMNQ